jgi:hypothetical protein
MQKILFYEEQRFTQWWLWVILLVAFFAVIGPFSYGIYLQEVLDKPFGDKPMSTGGLLVFGIFSTLIMIFVFWFIRRTKLITKITTEAIFVRYPPVINKWEKMEPKDIALFKIRTYKAYREFGGHGMKKRNKKYGQSYTVSGNIGLQLVFKNGKKLLIGTQKKNAIEFAVNKLVKSEQYANK